MRSPPTSSGARHFSTSRTASATPPTRPKRNGLARNSPAWFSATDAENQVAKAAKPASQAPPRPRKRTQHRHGRPLCLGGVASALARRSGGGLVQRLRVV